MQFSALQIASIINARIEGDPAVTVGGIAKIEEAVPGTLSFIANPKYEEYLYTTQASVIIVNEDLKVEGTVKPTLLRVENAYSAFAKLLEAYNEIMAGQGKKGIEQPSHIAASATVGADVYVGAFAYIGENARIGDKAAIYPGCYVGDNVTIGNNTILFPGVRIYHDCVLGSNVVVHAGTVIGSDGFGFAPQADGSYKKVPQIGNVLIEDHVEIGANTTIDRATMGSTVIRRGVKLDNLIQIAHNVEMGQNSVMAAQSGVSGSTKVGDNCMIGGQVGIVGHIKLANGTRINAQSGLSKSVTEANQALNGSPAFEYKSSLKSQAIFRNLPELQNRVHQLEEQIKHLMTELQVKVISQQSTKDNGE
jgi:UDP-3-O-[3-hydroxymyristoyl] glucosamine N-acyltransferase